MRALLPLILAAVAAAAELLPGWPRTLPQPEIPPPAWARRDGHLVAVAPDGGERWRLALAPGAQVWTGDGGALVADATGLRLVDAAGTARGLPPLPGDVAPLGVDRGTASFTQGSAGWLLPPEGAAQRIALGEEALAPALVAGDESLWLTMRHLVHHSVEGTVLHRHGLPVGRGWSLRRGADGRPLVLSPAGLGWSVPAYQPGEDDERLGIVRPLPPDAPRERRLRAALAARDWLAAQALATGTAERAALARWAGWRLPPGAEDLDPVPRDPAEAALPERAWTGAAAPRARSTALRAMPDTLDRDRPLAGPGEAHEEPPAAERTAAGLAQGRLVWLAEDDGERAIATCREDGRPLWYTRWLPEPGLVAPGRSLALVDGRLLVGEGDARLLVLDAGDGATEHDLRPRRLPVLPGRTWPTPDGVVVLYPPGRDDRLGWIGRDGSERDESLPAPARWVLATPDGEVWAALTDGRVLAARSPGAWRPISLPPALVGARGAALHPDGVLADGRLWRWE